MHSAEQLVGQVELFASICLLDYPKWNKQLVTAREILENGAKKEGEHWRR